MKTLTSSLAALAIVAVREGQWHDVARLMIQAANAPDTNDFLECTLGDNIEADALVNSSMGAGCSTSSENSLSKSVLALSAALEIDADEEKRSGLYDDEFHSLSIEGDDSDSDEEEDDFDFGDEEDGDDLFIEDEDLSEMDNDEEEAEDEDEMSESSSGLRLRLKK